LIQALHSRDSGLLESVLTVADLKLIHNTVRRLPPKDILPLLKNLVDRFQSSPGRAANLVNWIRAVLVEHAPYLMTVPELVKSLSNLYMSVDSRLNSHKKLLQLAGRLDLLFSQIDNQEATVSESKPSLVFEENSDEDDEEFKNDIEEDDDPINMPDEELDIDENDREQNENDREDENGKEEMDENEKDFMDEDDEDDDDDDEEDE